MSLGTFSYLTPEALARVRIDEMLDSAGWAVQDVRSVNLAAARGVAGWRSIPHKRACCD